MTVHYFAPWALLPEGWRADCLFSLDDTGTITHVECGVPSGPARELPGPVIPGMVNVHSHAHQRLIAGLTARPGPGPDSFWSWRTRMYRAVAGIDPDRLADVAAWLYGELLEGGYTSIGEFHYVHHQVDGRPWDDPAALSRAILEASRRSGMGMTILPVWYRYGGFSRKAPDSAQAPFLHEPEAYCRLVETLLADSRADGDRFRVGLAPHSLRAVEVADLPELLSAFPDLPVHIHIAEQTGEVDACREYCDRTPVALLKDFVDLDRRWCLIHATHATDTERDGMLTAGVVAGLCPTTEADLGDGIFPAVDYLAGGGDMAIGSDSNLRTDAAEELRLLEWSQRLRDKRRNLLVPEGARQGVGTFLWQHAALAGARALGQPGGKLAPGCRADWVVLDTSHALLAGLPPDEWLDSLVFAGGRELINEVWTAGQRRVAGGRHEARKSLRPGWLAARRALANQP